MPQINSEAILGGLNERQREAVSTVDGSMLVLAGPGSGKTRALTHRVAHLIASGIPPEAILALTFTNKAAGEMRTRVAALLYGNGRDDTVGNTDEPASNAGLVPSNHVRQIPPKARRFIKRSDPSASPFIGTFHGFTASVLRREAARIGYRPGFTIYDEDDSLSLIREVMRELGVDPKRFPAPMIRSILSGLKADLVSWDEYEGALSREPFEKTVAALYRTYQERLRMANALDFDDLIFYAVRLFRRDPKALARWQERFHYILIDEYQDTSASQYELIRLLASRHRNVFAIGDDGQAIYGWRRADYRNILNFERDWPEAKIILLEENYRSTPEILDAANRLISKNEAQKPKVLWTKNDAGRQPTVIAHEDERAEAEFIAGEIASLSRQDDMAWHDIAILYRTNAQSRAIEEAMIERGIPYVIVGGIRFFERREIKDLLAYLRYLENPEDALALKRIINVPARGIGPKTFLAWLSGKSAGLPARDREKISRFETLTERLRKEMSGSTLAEFLRRLLKLIEYEEYLAEVTREGDARIENVRELVSVARKYDALPIPEAVTRLLEDAALLSAEDEVWERDDRVRLTTIHAAKGLEFPAVFLAGLEEGILPHAKSIAAGKAELEEERRLCYVGMTRAKRRLYLTWAITRTIFGEREVNMPSRFLRELPPEVLADSRIPEADELLVVDDDA